MQEGLQWLLSITVVILFLIIKRRYTCHTRGPHSTQLQFNSELSKLVHFIKQYSRVHDIFIPDDIITICCAFYDTEDYDTMASSFDPHRYHEKFDLSMDNTLISDPKKESGRRRTRPRSEFGWLYEEVCIRCLDRNGNYGYTKGVHYMAVKFKSYGSGTYRSLTDCIVGVTTRDDIRFYRRRPKDSIEFNNTKWRRNWRTTDRDWRIGETMIMKMDLNKYWLYFYKEKIKSEKRWCKTYTSTWIEFQYKRKLKQDQKYYFVMYMKLCPVSARQFEIVPVDPSRLSVK